jgi:hypothetical protein
MRRFRIIPVTSIGVRNVASRVIDKTLLVRVDRRVDRRGVSAAKSTLPVPVVDDAGVNEQPNEGQARDDALATGFLLVLVVLVPY